MTISTDNGVVNSWLGYNPIKVLHTGSKVICDPPPDGTDDDWLFLLTPDRLAAMEVALQGQWVLGGSGALGQTNPAGVLSPNLFQLTEAGTPYLDTSVLFHSWKSLGGGNNYNFILTICEDFFNNFALATQMAKTLNLQEKLDRIMLFEAVVYDLWPQHTGVVYE